MRAILAHQFGRTPKFGVEKGSFDLLLDAFAFGGGVCHNDHLSLQYVKSEVLVSVALASSIH